jgi:hypothetical protein
MSKRELKKQYEALYKEYQKITTQYDKSVAYLDNLTLTREMLLTKLEELNEKINNY